MRIIREISIAAPHTAVWPLIDDDDRRMLWLPEIVATTYPAGRPKGDPTGTRFRVTVREGETIRSFAGEVSARVEGRLRAVRLADEHMVMDVEYRIGRQPSGTSVRFAGVFTLTGVSGGAPRGLLLEMARPMLERRVTDRLERLRSVAENGSSA